MRHNELRNFTAKLLRTVCRDVTIEPTLEELNGEILPKSNNSSDNACLDISARGFWTAGQKAFFDVRVFNPLAKRHAAHKLSKCYELNEKEKKTHYNKRILEVEHGSFTPLVFAATGGTGRECKKVYKRLAEMISEKEKSQYGDVMTYINRKLNFALIKSLIICIRGSRYSTTKTRDEDTDNLLQASPGNSEKLVRL